MPHITQEKLQPIRRGEVPVDAGGLNAALSIIVIQYLSCRKISYEDLNDVTAAFVRAKEEFAEKVTRPYYLLPGTPVKMMHDLNGVIEESLKFYGIVPRKKYKLMDPSELSSFFMACVYRYLKANMHSQKAIRQIEGALENALDEFRRQVLHSYEDLKIRENGNLYPEHLRSFAKEPAKETKTRKSKKKSTPARRKS